MNNYKKMTDLSWQVNEKWNTHVMKQHIAKKLDG